jgi:hypothetical protein
LPRTRNVFPNRNANPANTALLFKAPEFPGRSPPPETKLAPPPSAPFGGRRPKIIFAKWLTSQNHVISFRQADTYCGRESSRISQQFATPKRPLPRTSLRWTQGSLPPKNGPPHRCTTPHSAPGP